MFKVGFKYICIAITFCLTMNSHAEDQKKAPPLDPAFMGTHDLVLVSMGTTLFGYFMPDYEKPNSQQIIYKVNTKVPPIRFLVRDADLVTARTKPFNLQRLIRGEQIEVVADVYMGHFDRGGMKLHSETVLSFDEQLYLRTFDDIKPSSIRKVYDKVKVGREEFILVHRLQEKPSYDNLILFDDMVSCITEFTASSPVPNMAQLFNKLSLCGPMKPLYYETQSFQ